MNTASILASRRGSSQFLMIKKFSSIGKKKSTASKIIGESGHFYQNQQIDDVILLT